VLAAAAGVVAIAAGCGRKHALGQPALRKARPAYSVADVKRAFAAEGLPLTLESRYRGIFDLRPTDMNLFGMFAVTVWPPRSEASGPRLVLIMSGHRTISARNVVVDYAPTSAKAASIRSATARLRRTKGP
jgi:hypothetical protein